MMEVKKKLIGFTMAGLLLFGTGVWASTTGLYKDYVTVPVVVDGSSTTVIDVPAFNIDNRVVVPAYMLREAGVTVDMGGDGALHIDVPESEPVVKTVTQFVYVNVETNEVIPPTLEDGSPNPVIPTTPPVVTDPGETPTNPPVDALKVKCDAINAEYDKYVSGVKDYWQKQIDHTLDADKKAELTNFQTLAVGSGEQARTQDLTRAGCPAP